MNAPAFPVLDGPPLPEAVSLQAVEWMVALQAPDAACATRDACKRWRDAHPDHERAWRHIESFGAQLRELHAPLVHGALARGNRGCRQAIKALALAVFAGGSAWVARDGLRHEWQDWQSDHHTATGQHLAITLADATQIDLDTSSAIDVRFDIHQRLVRLLHGQILINTAPDPADRPFLVETRQGRLLALGTRYSVRQQAGRSHVAVFEGAVDVQPANASDAARIIRAGEQASFSLTAVDAPQAADAREASWSVGMLVAQDMPLAHFIAELARYRPGRVACDPDAAYLKVSGVYPLSDTDRVLDMLQRTHPVEIHSLTRYWITVRLRRA